jgi:hypothetical protein
MTNGLWRCKSCGMVLSTAEVEMNGGYCKECCNE